MTILPAVVCFFAVSNTALCGMHLYRWHLTRKLARLRREEARRRREGEISFVCGPGPAGGLSCRRER